MKSNADLLALYKEEKTLVIGGPDERTGLEDFPSFAEWKEEYVKEYNETHVSVSVEEADALMDAAVEEAEDELKELVDELDDDTVTENEDDEEMTEEVTAEAPVEVPAKPKAARARKTNVRAVKKPNVRAKKIDVRKAKPPFAAKKATRATSKAAKAQGIFNKLYGSKTRAEIIEKFISQAGLTANGAATYYQKMKKAAG